MAPPAGKQTTPPLTIVFFGLGAVGSSMLICPAELAERDGIPVRFKVFVIDPAAAREARRSSAGRRSATCGRSRAASAAW